MKRGFVRCDRRDVLFLFPPTVSVKWTRINTIRLMEIGSWLFKMLAVQFGGASILRYRKMKILFFLKS